MDNKLPNINIQNGNMVEYVENISKLNTDGDIDGIIKSYDETTKNEVIREALIEIIEISKK